MLTIKQITENTEAVLRGLEKKHFKNAKETIDQVIALNDKRRSTQNELDKNLAEVNSLSECTLHHPQHSLRQRTRRCRR